MIKKWLVVVVKQIFSVMENITPVYAVINLVIYLFLRHVKGADIVTIENGMSQEQKVKLKSLLIKHEGDRDYPYYDTLGNISIGIGRNLSGVGVRADEKELMYKNDVDFLYDYLSKTYSWFLELNEARQLAIIDMAFMGVKNFSSFKRMINALDIHDYQIASCEVIDSEYGRKYKNRSNDIANILLTGELSM